MFPQNHNAIFLRIAYRFPEDFARKKHGAFC